MVRVRGLVLALAAAGAFSSGTVLALGLGEIRLQSALNQPLQAEIELQDSKGLEPGEIVPALASPQAFKKQGLDRPAFLGDLKMATVRKPDGRTVIQISSSQAVREPALNLLVDVTWPSGHFMREYTLLVDPPAYAREPVASTAPRLPASAAAPAGQPAAPAPARPAGNVPARPAAPPAASAEHYRTVNHDRLWDIAAQNLQGGSIQQTMLAIQALNPDAFVGGNINRLKTGQTLQLPDADQVARLSRVQAVREVARQTRAWRRSSRRAAGVRQLDATRKAAAPAVATAQGAPEGSLSLVAAGHGSAPAGTEKGAAADGGGAAQNQLAVLKENLDSTVRENAELSERIKALQSQQEKLEQLLQLKDDQLKQLQTQAGSASQPAAVAPEVTASPAAPADQEVQPAAAASEPAPEPGLLDRLLDEPVWLGVAGASALSLLLGGLVLVRNRRRGQTPPAASGEARAAQVALKKRAAPPAEPTFAELMAQQATQQKAVDEQILGETSRDILKEVDTYTAYGRFSQAVELLQNALKDEPERTDLHLKLLEVQAETGDRQAFAHEEARLRTLGGARVEPELARLRARFPEMAAGVAAAVTASAVAPAAIPPVADDLNFDDLVLEAPAAVAAPTAPVAAAAPEPSPSPAPAGVEAPGKADDLDFDFDLPEDSVDIPALTARHEEPLEDFSLDDAGEQVHQAPGEKLEAYLSDLQADEGESAPEQTGSPLPDDFDLALDEPPPVAEPVPPAPAAAAASPVPAAGFEGLDEDFDFLADTDENSTKLDLARAYIEMGDAEGAKDILGEIVSDGSPDQQKEARDMLATLA